MTSNQIAYANTQIADRAELETERHDRATEEIQAKLAAVEEVKAQNDYRYKQQMLDVENRKLDLQDRWNRKEITVKEQYNQMWEAIQTWEKSIQQNYNEERLRIDNTLADLKGQQMLYDQEYRKTLADLEVWKGNLSYKETQYKALSDLSQTLIRNETELLKAKLHNIPSIVASTVLDTLGVKDFSLQGIGDSIRSLVETDLDTAHKKLSENLNAATATIQRDVSQDSTVNGSIPLTAPAIREYNKRNLNRSTSEYYFRGRPQQ